MDVFSTLTAICDARKTDDKRLRLSPVNLDQLTAVMSAANRYKQPLSVLGADKHRWLDAAQEHNPLLLDMRRISGVLDYKPADMTLTALAGTSIGEIQQLIGENGQELALDVDSDDATIGGIFASGWNGLRSRSKGMNRDRMIGLEAMLPDATIYQSGGKVVKNVTGYDLSRLLSGAHGTLGVFTQISVRLTPKPARRCILLWPYERLQSAAQDMFKASQQVQVVSCGALSAPLLPTIDQSPFCDTDILGWVVLEDGPLAIKELTSRLFKVLGKALISLDFGDRLDSVWKELLAAPRQFLNQKAGMIEIGFAPAANQNILDLALADNNHGIIYSDRGVLYTRCRMDYPEPIHHLREQLEPLDAHLQFRGSAPQGTDYYGKIGAVSWLQKIKSELDPHHILNPGHGIFRSS